MEKGKGGFTFFSSDDADDGNHCDGTRCGALYANVISMAIAYAPSDAEGILAVGTFAPGSRARISLEGWVSLADYPVSRIIYASNVTDVTSANFSAYKMIYIPSNDLNTPGGISATLNRALISVKQKVIDFVNKRSGSLVVLTQAGFGRESYGFLPVPLNFTQLDFQDVDVMEDMVQISRVTNSDNVDHSMWHGYWTGPIDWNGLRVLATQARLCPEPYGPKQNCRATVLCNQNTILTAENCYDGIDNDGDGLIDRADSDCWRCGNGITDPDEQCDDGNVLDGDGCSSTCRFQNLPPPSIMPSPPPPPPTNGRDVDYCFAGGLTSCPPCMGKCSTVDNFGANGIICKVPQYLKGSYSDSDVCRNNLGILALQIVPVSYPDASGASVVVGKATFFRTPSGKLFATVQMNCPYLLWSPSTDASGLDVNNFMLLSYVVNGVAGTAVSALKRSPSSSWATFACYTFEFNVDALQPGGLGCTPIDLNARVTVRSVFARDSTSSSTCNMDSEKCSTTPTPASAQPAATEPATPEPTPTFARAPEPGPAIASSSFSSTSVATPSFSSSAVA
ncbi:hypothetical protein HYH02_004961 [Chlamydomonas schloesseri]|uniref:DUF4215 domain-containing protein n=1 Tax=Chlamydomonas schloesseri TaxID=2026947 RepID=A0A836B8L1_9CHLO|nr:hypothetical protein HYH02_004961 [Chlamydomonas schloesseri]|eukprot:KAG2450459.1 hypothetical protein HYH02_004961 [Chlamydomonas schloesseri]